MISRISKQARFFNLISPIIHTKYSPSFSSQKKFKIITDPKDISKLIFQPDGRCKIFQHKNGESQLKFVFRALTFTTIFNSILLGLQLAYPIFGSWNQFSFSMVAGLGYFSLLMLQNLSRRTVHRMYLHKDLETIDIQFFNALWKPQTINFHLSEFQNPNPSFIGFTRFDLTSIGKAWIKLQKNQFRNVKDYEQTLDSILLGKPLTNINISRKK